MSNFMTNFTGAKLFADRPYASKNFGKASWDAAIKAGYNKTQIKVALQQLGQQGYGIGSELRTKRMQGTPGIAVNPLSKYQGPQGNFGLKSYNAAKNDGLTTAEIGAHIGSSGMFMPSGSMNQYNQDIADQQAQMQAQMQADMERWQAEFQAAQVPTITRSGNPGAVGQPAAGMQIAQGDDYSGGNRNSGSLNRDSDFFMNNLGGLGSALGAVSSLNIG